MGSPLIEVSFFLCLLFVGSWRLGLFCSGGLRPCLQKKEGRAKARPYILSFQRDANFPLAAVDAVVPGDAKGARFYGYFDGVAVMEAIEVVEVDGQAFKTLPGAPRPHKQAAAAANDAFHVEAAFDGGWIVGDAFLRVEAAVDEQCGRENPWKWNKAGVDALENFDLLAITGAPLQDYRQEQDSEKNQTEENEHQVDVEGRVDLADVREGQRTEEKNGGAEHQPAAEHDLGGSGRETARGTLIGGSFGAAIKAVGHGKWGRETAKIAGDRATVNL
jgi:hypothetical protein